MYCSDASASSKAAVRPPKYLASLIMRSISGSATSFAQLTFDEPEADLPVIVSEWNRGIASAGDEPTAAQFIYRAYEWLHDWNTTPGSHNIVAACWFVYPGGVGWDQYALEYWKTGGGNQESGERQPRYRIG